MTGEIVIPSKVGYALVALLTADVGVNSVDVGRDVFATDNPGAQIAALQTSIKELSDRVDRVVAEVISMYRRGETRENEALDAINARLERMENRYNVDMAEIKADIKTLEEK